jgi:hypothetical protein
MGLVLILLGIATLGGWARWSATRIWTPLNEPVSLLQAHIRTPEFQINIPSAYQIEVEVNRGFDFWGVPCLIGGHQCQSNPGVLALSWSLSRVGRVIANGSSNGSDRTNQGKATLGRVVGGFDAGKGSYVLDLDVLQDGSRLNGGAPRLVVFEAGYAHWDYNDIRSAIFLLFLLLTGSGIYLINRSARQKLAALARNYSLTQPGPQPRNLWMDREPPAAPAVPTGFRPPVSACVGAVLVLSGLAAYAYIQNGTATRSFVPVDMPVSLAAGHLKTGPFRTDLGEYYSISIEVDNEYPENEACAVPSVLKTRWILYREGKVADGSDESVAGYGSQGGFTGERGVYDLDVEVMKDAACLDARHPRLSIVAWINHDAGRTMLFLFLCTFCIGVGGTLLAIGGVERVRKWPPPVAPFVGKTTIFGNTRWKRRPSTPRPFSRMSYIGLVTANTYLLLLIPVIPVCILQSWAYMVPKGLKVHLLRFGITAQRNPGIQPVLVQLETRGQRGRPSLYVNFQPVSWEDFGVVLQKELNQRPPNWPVYFQGDPDMEWDWAGKTIDTIRGLQAEVILLTAAPGLPQVQGGPTTAPKPADAVPKGRR